MTARSARSLQRITVAQDAYKRAAQSLCQTIERELPVGTVVHVRRIGPARACDIRVTVHGSWWCEPAQLRGVNVVTGRPRVFSFNDVEHVVSRPGAD